MRPRNALMHRRSAGELRSPMDAQNLATLFGLTDDDARAALGNNARECLQRARLRRNEHGVQLGFA